MSKHTIRDSVWDNALRFALDEESLNLQQMCDVTSNDVSKRTIRDTLNTMVDQGWLSKDTPQAHEWNPGPKCRGEEPETPTGATPVEKVGELTEGEKYIAVVDRMSTNDNAVVMNDDQPINLGPINESAVGKRVEFLFVRGGWGRCLDEEYTYHGYNPHHGKGTTTKNSTSLGKLDTGSSTDDTSPDDPENKNKLLNGHL